MNARSIGQLSWDSSAYFVDKGPSLKRRSTVLFYCFCLHSCTSAFSLFNAVKEVMFGMRLSVWLYVFIINNELMNAHIHNLSIQVGSDQREN